MEIISCEMGFISWEIKKISQVFFSCFFVPLFQKVENCPECVGVNLSEFPTGF